MNRYLIVLIAALALTACGGSDEKAANAAEGAEQAEDAGHAEEAGHEEEGHEESEAKGPHGGRLLKDGDVAVEVTIFESGVPPEFRVYVTQSDKSVAPAQVNLTIELARLGGRTDKIDFTPVDDYLRGNAEVEEPHSFDVTVTASVNGKPHVWTYDSPEGRTTIAADMAAKSGVQVAKAGPATLRERISLYGTVVPNAERVRQVSARYPGVIRAVQRQAGDRVKAGDVLATVESNESLQTYSVTAPIAGVITERMANAGETTGDAPLFVVTDLAGVWADFSVFPRDRGRLSVGQEAQVSAADGDQKATGRITYLSPVGAVGQPLSARVVLDNRTGQWTPGMFVSGDVTIGKRQVKLAVPMAAVQSLRDWKVVFANVGDIYEARPLTLGRDDGEWVEVLGGHLAAGDSYVVGNSFLVKADIEKAGASHDH